MEITNSRGALEQDARVQVPAGLKEDILDDAIYYRLFLEAESVRWKMSDIPWSELAYDRVNRGLIELVREITSAELTTWSAANSFFQGFADDIDFTQWVTVWLYEETKHPQVLMRWLKQVGESCDREFMLAGRQIHPIMKSKMGTLVFNILSEIEASSIYMGLNSGVNEPVLRLIAKNLAADEARHASSFYSYAKQVLDSSDTPDRERVHALEALYLWLSKSGQVKHPVALFVSRVSGGQEEEVIRLSDLTGAKIQARMIQMIGKLAGVTMNSRDDVRNALASIYGAHRDRTNTAAVQP